MKQRRTVALTDGSSRRGRLWAYGYADLARLLGTTANAVRVSVARGRFDPGVLEEVCMRWLSTRKDEGEAAGKG